MSDNFPGTAEVSFRGRGRVGGEGIAAGLEPSDGRGSPAAVLLVSKVDRFGWSLRHLFNASADFDAYGIPLVSLRDKLDLSTPSRRLTLYRPFVRL
jgi:Resolvase, N terminal domain